MENGLASCCPLADTPGSALRTFRLGREGPQAPQGLLSPQFELRRDAGGSLLTIQATLPDHPIAAGREGKPTAGLRDWGSWHLASLLTCSRSGYTRHTQTQSLSGLRALERKEDLGEKSAGAFWLIAPTNRTILPKPHRPPTARPSPSQPSALACPRHLLPRKR